MKINFLIFIILFLVSCSHPESNDFKSSNNNEKGANIFNKDVEIDHIVEMKEESGVYFVPIKINGVDMEFVFDTGASSISISETEAMFLWKQGKLKEDDIQEDVQFIDANGDISNGTRINLREVQIGDLIVNDVEASVVHNQQAPLLFGQSAMNRFGKITIDYENNRIIFN
jgi:aspartyl protease family protein